MRRFRDQLKVVLVAITGGLLLIGLLPLTGLAADNRQGQTVTVGPNEVVNDDLYVAATTVDIQGTINGNLIAVGTTITISGTVTRDVMAAGSQISIPGTVEGSARLAGSQVTVDGKITGDLVTVASALDLTPEATVGRDVMAAGTTLTLAGSIARNAQLAGTDVVISAPIGGNVTAQVTSLKLESGAAIGGNLDYTSNQSVNKAAGATVAGYTHQSLPTNNSLAPGWWLIGWLQTLVGFFVLGLLLIFLTPGFNNRAVAAYRLAPWSRLGIGLAVAVVVPVVALPLFIVGLFVGGWWLAIFLMGIYTLGLTVAFAIVSQMVGRFALERLGQANFHPILALFVGLPILTLASAIPWVGWLIGLIAVVYGLGVVVLALPWSRPQTPQAAAVAMPPSGVMRPTPTAG